MAIPELYPEIWSQIISYLERPKPPVKTEEWSKLHQNDLASVMRVSKMHFDVTAPILYREPVVENVWSFLQSKDLDTSASYDTLAQQYQARASKIMSKPYRPTSLTSDDQSSATFATAKAYCFKHTKRIHLILLKRTFAFSYFAIFFLEVPSGRKDLWEYLEAVEEPSKITRAQMSSRQVSSNLSCSWIGLLYTKLSPITKCPSHRQLNPHALTSGTFGDMSWNERSVNLALDLEMWQSKGLKTVVSSLVQSGWITRDLWSAFKPKLHCTRYQGGPYGTFNTLLHQWGDHRNAPRSVFIHCDDSSYEYTITLGARNVVYFLSDITHISEYTWRERIVEIAGQAKSVFKERQVTREILDRTEVHMYGLPGLQEGSVISTKKTCHKRQKELDEDHKLGPLQGKIKVYPRSSAPICGGCGKGF